MKVRGYPIVTRHAPREVEGASSGDENVIILVAVPAVDGQSSPIPADHPLAIRYREPRPRIVSVADWKQAIQVGGVELAVA